MPDGQAASPESRTIYSRSNRWLDLLILALFSAFFFVTMALRSSSKFLWFDELCTLDICRLPTFAGSWQAVLHGADYNPPLFYLIERATRSLLGEGLIALRLPSMLGIWFFCVSLYRVVSQRVGRLGGTIALLFPLCTVAAYYACEMRPHAIVLGFCGLAIYFWQRAENSRWYSLPFGLCCAAAFLTHCYAILIAVPFGMAELWRIMETRRPRFSMWLAILAPVVLAAIAYLPLLHAYKQTIAGTGFAYIFRPGFWQIHYFDLFVFSPFIGVLTCGLLLLALQRSATLSPGRPELVLYVGFVLLPFFAVVLAFAINGPFIPRYFLAAVAGFASLLGLAFGNRNGRKRVSVCFLAVMCIAQGRNLGGLVAHHIAGEGEILEEPAIHIPVNTTPGKPLADHHLVIDETPGTFPIVVAEPMDFLYLVHYAPQLMPRLNFVTWSPNETNYRLYRSERTWCHQTYNPALTYAEFLPHNKAFYVYGDPLNLPQFSALTKAGAKVEAFTSDDHHWLARVTFY